MTVLKTDTSQFPPLPDYPFAENYFSISDPDFGELRMHYVDEGPRDAPVVLMLHGEPSWSFAWRKVITEVANAGYRAVAPDHIGFGKSDKLENREDYSYSKHKDWMEALVIGLNLKNITLACQDWGGPIGLSTLARCEDRFSAVVVCNTLLPNNQAPPQGIADWPGDIVTNWVAMVKKLDDLPVADIVNGVCVSPLPAEVLRAYNAPFPDPSHKAGVLSFPVLIPISHSVPGSEENRQVWKVLEQWHKPFVVAFSDSDPSTAPWAEVFKQRVPGAKACSHPVIAEAGHFVQEEKGTELGKIIIEQVLEVL